MMTGDRGSIHRSEGFSKNSMTMSKSLAGGEDILGPPGAWEVALCSGADVLVGGSGEP